MATSMAFSAVGAQAGAGKLGPAAAMCSAALDKPPGSTPRSLLPQAAGQRATGPKQLAHSGLRIARGRCLSTAPARPPALPCALAARPAAPAAPAARPVARHCRRAQVTTARRFLLHNCTCTSHCWHATPDENLSALQQGPCPAPPLHPVNSRCPPCRPCLPPAALPGCSSPPASAVAAAAACPARCRAAGVIVQMEGDESCCVHSM